MSNIPQDADRRGYLLEDYRLFHLKQSRAQRFSYHYHEFDKVVVFLSGQVTYTVEGRAYFLSPGDLLLVPHHHIHQPDIGSSTYERYILWLRPEFLSRYGLDPCFRRASETGFPLIRTDEREGRRLTGLLRSLEEALEEGGFGHELLAQTCCLQFLVGLNRAQAKPRAGEEQRFYSTDPKIEQVMAYINAHLTQPLTVPRLAGEFFLSSSWLMHRFKEVTGCTVHQYVLQKRLILAADLIREGTPVMQAARNSGFSDYSTFLRAFRAVYRISPKALREDLKNS